MTHLIIIAKNISLLVHDLFLILMMSIEIIVINILIQIVRYFKDK